MISGFWKKNILKSEADLLPGEANLQPREAKLPPEPEPSLSPDDSATLKEAKMPPRELELPLDLIQIQSQK